MRFIKKKKKNLLSFKQAAADLFVLDETDATVIVADSVHDSGFSNKIIHIGNDNRYNN